MKTTECYTTHKNCNGSSCNFETSPNIPTPTPAPMNILKTLALYPVTEEQYYEQMCCLAPLDRRNGCFLVGEASSERLCEVTNELTDTYQGYVRFGALCFYVGHETTRAEFGQFLDSLNIQEL